MGPEQIADELDRLARILITEGSGKVEPLPDRERQEYRDRLETLLADADVRVAILCIARDTRLFLEGYLEGQEAHTHLRSMIAGLL